MLSSTGATMRHTDMWLATDSGLAEQQPSRDGCPAVDGTAPHPKGYFSVRAGGDSLKSKWPTVWALLPVK